MFVYFGLNYFVFAYIVVMMLLFIIYILVICLFTLELPLRYSNSVVCVGRWLFGLDLGSSTILFLCA